MSLMTLGRSCFLLILRIIWSLDPSKSGSGSFAILWYIVITTQLGWLYRFSGNFGNSTSQICASAKFPSAAFNGREKPNIKDGLRMPVRFTLTLREDVGVEIFLFVWAAWRHIAQLAAVHRRQSVDRQSQRCLWECCLHVGEVETVRGFSVQLQYFVPCI